MANKDLADALGGVIRDAREELITRAWFGRNPTSGSREAHGPEAGARDLSPSLQLGWDFPKEPTHERDGPSRDIDR